jgi:hypothetical protein
MAELQRTAQLNSWGSAERRLFGRPTLSIKGLSIQGVGQSNDTEGMKTTTLEGWGGHSSARRGQGIWRRCQQQCSYLDVSNRSSKILGLLQTLGGFHVTISAVYTQKH